MNPNEEGISLREYFNQRVCWICEKIGWCRHRQIDIARAELDWLELNRPRRKPVESSSAMESAEPIKKRTANG